MSKSPLHFAALARWLRAVVPAASHALSPHQEQIVPQGRAEAWEFSVMRR